MVKNMKNINNKILITFTIALLYFGESFGQDFKIKIKKHKKVVIAIAILLNEDTIWLKKVSDSIYIFQGTLIKSEYRQVKISFIIRWNKVIIACKHASDYLHCEFGIEMEIAKIKYNNYKYVIHSCEGTSIIGFAN